MPTTAKVLHWLASYPKSGNTWMRLLLANYLSADDRPVSINFIRGAGADPRQMFDLLTGLSSRDCTDCEADRLRPAVYRLWASCELPRRVTAGIKTHDACRDTSGGEPLFPEDVTAGAVYLVRDPLDVIVSWSFFFGYGDDFSRAIADLANPSWSVGGAKALRQWLRTWSEHVESWLAAPFPVLVVRYEDLTADTVGSLRRVVRFLGLDDPPDEERVRQAVAFSSFRRLRAEEATDGFQEAPPWDCGAFFRSGRVGTGRKLLSEAQIEAVVATHGDTMARFGYPLETT